MKSHFDMLNIEDVDLDSTNPRIAEALRGQKEINAAAIALALGAGRDVQDNSSTTYSSLKESIRANGGIINPIIVKDLGSDRYVVVEGNTRLQIYKDFKKQNAHGEWDKIPALVYDEMSLEEEDHIRLQSHLVGPRPWDPYAKARYLYELNIEQGIPLNHLVPFCGGKASEVAMMIDAYLDMEEYYRPLSIEMGISPNVRKYSAFRELQNRNVSDAIARAGYTKEDFARWVINENIDTMQSPRALPKILADDEAREVFLKSNATEAKKVISAKEVSGFEELERVPLQKLLSVINDRLDSLPYSYVRKLQSDIDEEDTRQALYELDDNVKIILEAIEEA